MYHFNMTYIHHFNSGKIVAAIFLMLAFSGISYSQVPGKKETLDYINKKLGGTCVIEINKGTIIATYHSPDGKTIREDRVFSGALDTAALYDAEEQLLFIPCLSVDGDCVTRSLYVQKINNIAANNFHFYECYGESPNTCK